MNSANSSNASRRDYIRRNFVLRSLTLALGITATIIHYNDILSTYPNPVPIEFNTIFYIAILTLSLSSIFIFSENTSNSILIIASSIAGYISILNLQGTFSYYLESYILWERLFFSGILNAAAAFLPVLWFTRGSLGPAAVSASASASNGDDIDHFGFSMAQNGNATVFSYRGAGAGTGFWVGLAGFGALPGLLGAMAAGWVGFFAVMAVVLLCGVPVHWFKSRKGSFSVSPTAIVKNGETYDAAKVTELLWRNKAGEVQATSSGGTVLVGGTGIVGAAAATQGAIRDVSAAFGNTMQASMAKRGYQVAIRYGRKVVPLATNLTEDVAVALFNEVGRKF